MALKLGFICDNQNGIIVKKDCIFTVEQLKRIPQI